MTLNLQYRNNKKAKYIPFWNFAYIILRFIHSTNFLSANYVLKAVLDAGDTRLNKTDKNSCYMELTILFISK